MRRQVQEVPSDLPHARLYLDDIEAITKVLLEEMSAKFKADIATAAGTKLLAGDNAAKFEPRVIYVLGQVEMDSIADLQEHGGSVVSLEVRIENSRFYQTCSFSFRRHRQPSVQLYSLDPDRAWAAFAKLQAIFKKRQIFLKNLVEDLPAGWTFSSFIVVSMTALLLDIANIVRRYSGSLSLTIEILCLLNFLLFALGVLVYIAVPSRVYLVRSHERSRASAENRRKYVFAAITFVLGVLCTEVIHRIVERFLR